jgi:glucokinase
MSTDKEEDDIRVGIDLGGTRIKIAAVRGDKVLKSAKVETPATEGPAKVMDTIARAVKELVPAPRELGMAIPGEVAPSGRVWRLPNIPGFEGFEIAAELGRRTGARVVVENDATTAAYGEALYGHGRRYASFLLVTLGTGVGGGLVIGRQLVRGSHGFAGEVGHVTVDPSESAPRCACGRTGCLEAFAGTEALLETFRKSGGGEAREVLEVAESAHRREPAGLEAFKVATRALGIALNSVQNLLDLDAIVFGGGVSKSFDLIEGPLRAELRARRYGEPLSEVPLVVSEFSDLAGVVGAAHLPSLGAAQ